MKILVFNGSPKKEKSDTMHITRAFLDGMEEVDKQEIQMVDVIDRHIEFCRGCFTCKQNGGHCVMKDDMREILEQIFRKRPVAVQLSALQLRDGCYAQKSH